MGECKNQHRPHEEYCSLPKRNNGVNIDQLKLQFRYVALKSQISVRSAALKNEPCPYTTLKFSHSRTSQPSVTYSGGAELLGEILGEKYNRRHHMFIGGNSLGRTGRLLRSLSMPLYVRTPHAAVGPCEVCWSALVFTPFPAVSYRYHFPVGKETPTNYWAAACASLYHL